MTTKQAMKIVKMQKMTKMMNNVLFGLFFIVLVLIKLILREVSIIKAKEEAMTLDIFNIMKDLQ